MHEVSLRDFVEYQNGTATTAIYPGQGELGGLMYVALGLAGEAGEIANKVKKIYRDGEKETSADVAIQLADELGDVLWYVSQMTTELGFALRAVAERNLQKLHDRQVRSVLQGSGDTR